MFDPINLLFLLFAILPTIVCLVLLCLYSTIARRLEGVKKRQAELADNQISIMKHLGLEVQEESIWKRHLPD